MSTPPFRPEYRNVDAFLAGITGSGSGGHSGADRNTGTSTGVFQSDSSVPGCSGMPTGTSSAVDATGCVLIPVFRSESTTMQKVAELVAELATDLDGAIALGGKLPFDGEALRAHYRDAVRQHPLHDVLADLHRRRAEQVLCRLCELSFPATAPGIPA